MKYISSALFIIGFIIICLGICLGNTTFMLAIKMLAGGVVTMGVGYILTEIYEWRAGVRYGL